MFVHQRRTTTYTDLKDGSCDPQSSDDRDDAMPLFGSRAVQLLGIRANFPICAINGYDGQMVRRIYHLREGEVQEEGMVDLVPVGPGEIFMAQGCFGLQVYYFATPPGDEGFDGAHLRIEDGWDVCDDEEIEEYTQTICAGSDRKFEITYLVIPDAIEAKVKVRLKLRDLGSGSRTLYGKIKASATDFVNKSIHLFSCERRRSLSFPSGSTSILPLRPFKIAVPCCRQLELHIEVDLTVITPCDSQEEKEKNLKFNLKFTHGIGISIQERDFDNDGVEVSVTLGKYQFDTLYHGRLLRNINLIVYTN
ncbi:hypothetical protein EJB05_10772, partial [Eragrostis curvula]